MIKLISFPICPFVQRIAALLEGANLDYEVEYIELSDKPDWFLELSPHGQVPILITKDGVALFESDAISDYLLDTFFPTRYIFSDTASRGTGTGESMGNVGHQELSGSMRRDEFKRPTFI